MLPRELHADVAIHVVIFAIGISTWVQYARTVRGSTMVEKSKEYVQAAQVTGLPPALIVVRQRPAQRARPGAGHRHHRACARHHHRGDAVVPGSRPLGHGGVAGTLIRIGNDYLFSGEWWITIFPSAALIVIVLAVNVLGDWLRDVLNPKLR